MRVNISRHEKNYEFNLEQITQLTGVDFKKKNYILTSLKKHFSSSKYYEYEEEMIDNVRLDGELVGRKYFNSYCINNRQELIESIKLTKTSIFMSYFKSITSELDNQFILQELSDKLEELYIDVNKILEKNIGRIEIGYDAYNVLDIIQKSDLYSSEKSYIEEMSDKDLLTVYINLITELSKKTGENALIMINDIDHIITANEYVEFIDKLKDKVAESNNYFILTLSTESFVYLDEDVITGINVINDEIFEFPQLERMESFINENYPCILKIDNRELIEILKGIVNIVGNDIAVDIRSVVLKKLINSTLGLNKEVYKLNQEELAFLKE